MGRALMSQPDLVMLDEPSLGLAPLLVRDIFQIINRINAEGRTVLLVEQNAYAALSHRGLRLYSGSGLRGSGRTGQGDAGQSQSEGSLFGRLSFLGGPPLRIFSEHARCKGGPQSLACSRPHKCSSRARIAAPGSSSSSRAWKRGPWFMCRRWHNSWRIT